MGWVEFLASLVDSLAWPASLLVLVFLVRDELKKLIPALENLRYKGFEVEFGRKVAELEEQAEAADLPPSESYLGDDQESVVARLVPISPRAAVMEAWREVEMAMRGAARRHDIGLSQQLGVRLMAEELSKAGVLSPSTVDLLSDLRALRNEAAHAKEVDLAPGDAWEYAQLAERIRNKLDSSEV